MSLIASPSRKLGKLCDRSLRRAKRERRKRGYERSGAALRVEAEMQALRDRYLLLSRREREVMALIVRGLLNKQVAGELGISEITVKAHRGQVMRKMNVASFAELVNVAAKLDLAHSQQPQRKAL